MTFRKVAARTRRANAERTVLDATAALLNEGAEFTDLSVEQITSRAGISRTAFYSHFVDKGALLIRLLESIVDPVYVRANEELSGLPSGPEHVDAALRSVVAMLAEHAPTLRATVFLAVSDPEVARSHDRILGKISAPVAARIKSQQDAGVALPCDPSRLADLLVVMAVDMIGLHLGRTDDQEPVIEALTLVWRRSIYGSK